MPFLITGLAGMSTLLGALIIVFKCNKEKMLASSLAFAAGVMISMSIFDLIPEAWHLIVNEYNIFTSVIWLLILINIGFILSMLINYLLPHMDNNIYRVGIISMLAIILHNIPEGIATFLTSDVNTVLGISFGVAIAAHNIPEGITIAAPIYYATKSKKKAFKYVFISGLSELFGALIAFIFLKPIINNLILGCIYAVIAGIMINISFYELLPTAFKLKKTKVSLLFFIIGFVFILLFNLLIK